MSEAIDPAANDQATDPTSHEEAGLQVEVDGFTGPLDVLLGLARKQKVDLTKISILALVDQYFAFLDEARARRLDLAADYLVTASWLAYLKSKLLLPQPAPEEEAEAEWLAEALTQRLQRLEALRGAVVQLLERPRLGEDRLPRGAPEGLSVRHHDGYDVALGSLLRAYGSISRRQRSIQVRFRRPEVVPIDVARALLRDRVKATSGWLPFEQAVGGDSQGPALRRSLLASSFAAALELARGGEIDLRQAEPFDTLMLRRL